MLQVKHAAENSYQVFGTGKINLVIEMGLGATMGEWWHIAQRLSEKHTVLLYERSRNISIPRTPENIAKELRTLLTELNTEQSVALLAHSQGGLYAQQFARLYPGMVRGIVLLDPLSARDSEYKTLLTPKEQKASGFDKTANLAITEKLAKLHLGRIIKAVMKNAPPFYYYNDFSADARSYILSALTRPELYTAALEEYRLAHEKQHTASLREGNGFPNIPLVLVTHTPEFSIRETMEFGHTDRAFAERVEQIWQSFMLDYLSFSNRSSHLQAANSGHSIHLTEPALIDRALDFIINTI